MTDERTGSERENEDEPRAEQVEDLEVASEESESIKGGLRRRSGQDEEQRASLR